MDKLNLRLLIAMTFLLLTQTASLKALVTIGSDQEMKTFHIGGCNLNQGL